MTWIFCLALVIGGFWAGYRVGYSDGLLRGYRDGRRDGRRERIGLEPVNDPNDTMNDAYGVQDESYGLL